MLFSKSGFYTFYLLLIFVGLSAFARAQDCVDVVIGALPYVESSSTCGEGVDVGGNNVCNAWNMSGEDIVYSFTTTSESCLFIELSGFDAGAAGVMISSDCPTDFGGQCVGNLTSSFNATSLSGTVSTQANTTYYFTVGSDSWMANCIDFDFSLSADCPAPNTNDCLGAINMCDGYFYEENAPTGNGNYPDDLPNNGCAMVAVDNMGWYQLTTQTAGVLNFTLTPNAADDYDWILFDLTDAGCAEIATNPNLVVSCNTYGLLGANAATGISSANGGTGNANGPGDINGPAFNADLNVEAGETYVLMISNWSATPNGYELDFGESTATFIDNIPPEVESVQYNCEGSVDIIFSEYIDCATALPEYFTVEGPGGPYTVTDVESACQDGSDYSIGFTLSYNTAFPSDGGIFNLIFEANEVADVCGNFLEPVTIPVDVPAGMELEITTTPASCDAENGALTVDVIAGGSPPFLFSVSGSAFQSESTFSGLGGGDYTVTVKDDTGCTGAITATIEVEAIEFTAGTDAHVCNLSFMANATVPAGYTGEWTAPASVQMSNITNPNCIFTPQTAGTYTFTWTITNGVNCTVDKSIEVTFTAIQVADFSLTQPTCFEKCDGTAQVAVSGVLNMDELTYSWSAGNSSAASPDKASQLCAGVHQLSIATPEGCALTYPFELANPSPLSLGTVTVSPESCPKFCDGSIAFTGGAAELYSFDGGSHFSASTSIDSLCAGNYYLAVKNGSGCRRDTAVTVGQPAGPRARFAAEPNRQSSFNPHFEFENLSENYISSYWQFDYPEGAAISRKQDAAYTYADAEVGDYTVMLAVNDVAGCTDTAFYKVVVFEDTWVYIPNGFTPNEDGVNDIFRPVLKNVVVDDYKLLIFNRWGQKVFETNDVDGGWNGSVSGGDYYGEPGTYAYRIHIRARETGEAREWNGTVVLVR